MSTVFYEFFQTPEQLRRVGARGGRATARNRRDLSSAAPAPPPEGPAALECQETVAEAIALLDAQFPWLCDAEKRGARS